MIIVGAGPAALACAVRLRTEPNVEVVMMAPGASSSFLGGALAVATGDATVETFRSPVRLEGVEVLDATVDAVDTGRVRIDGTDVAADAVVVAAGLATDAVGGDGRSVVGFWDLDGAAAAADAIGGFDRGHVGVVIAGPLYRCPPAPYGLAIRLARRAARLGLDVRVSLTTPEATPLAAVGSAVTELLVGSCRAAGVEVHYGVTLDPDALDAGRVAADGAELAAFDLAVVVPRHRAHPLVADLAGTNQLVEVDGYGRSARPGVHVAGDAVASPFPRASAPAMVSGVAAANGVLTDLGLESAASIGLPEPDCFVDQGDGDYSRIQISYPEGPPPAAAASVVIGEPRSAAAGGFDASVEGWRHVCGAPLA